MDLKLSHQQEKRLPEILAKIIGIWVLVFLAYFLFFDRFSAIFKEKIIETNSAVIGDEIARIVTEKTVTRIDEGKFSVIYKHYGDNLDDMPQVSIVQGDIENKWINISIDMAEQLNEPLAFTVQKIVDERGESITNRVLSVWFGGETGVGILTPEQYQSGININVISTPDIPVGEYTAFYTITGATIDKELPINIIITRP